MFKYLAVFFVAMLPILELRGAIPFALGLGVPYIPALLISILGNLVPIPFVYMFGRTFLKWGSKQKYVGFFCKKLLEKGELAGKRIVASTGRGGALVALTLFVGIPLPGTGAWTGVLAASLLNLGPKITATAVGLGVLMAGVIMLVTSGSVFHLVGI